MEKIIDCVESVESLFDSDFKNKDLSNFCKMKGKTFLLSSIMNKTMYAFQSSNKFYLNIIEEIDDVQIHFKVYEILNFGDLIRGADKLLKWDRDRLTGKLIETFNIPH